MQPLCFFGLDEGINENKDNEKLALMKRFVIILFVFLLLRAIVLGGEKENDYFTKK